MRDTSHLDEMEDLAYRRMLDLYYLKESPLPKSIPEIAKLIRMRTHCESIANVLQEYFALTEHGYVNAKANATLLKIYDKSEKAKKSAEKRWDLQRLKNANALQTQCEGNANGMLPNNPIPNDTKPINYVDSGESTPRPKKASRRNANQFEPSKEMDYIEKSFNVFWVNVEKKGVGKAASLTAFRKIMENAASEDEIDFRLNVICAYYEKYLAEDPARLTQDGKKYLQQASTFINAAGWRNDREWYINFKKQWDAQE